mmetsp:Transcript_26505/g.37623  ORF Transcript_26505/g.37623 Transcript_26505/m.37623 type:complete len:109 (-) Transcript_26505:1190-1516(-)
MGHYSNECSKKKEDEESAKDKDADDAQEGNTKSEQEGIVQVTTAEQKYPDLSELDFRSGFLFISVGSTNDANMNNDRKTDTHRAREHEQQDFIGSIQKEVARALNFAR